MTRNKSLKIISITINTIAIEQRLNSNPQTAGKCTDPQWKAKGRLQ